MIDTVLTVFLLLLILSVIIIAFLARKNIRGNFNPSRKNASPVSLNSGKYGSLRRDMREAGEFSQKRRISDIVDNINRHHYSMLGRNPSQRKKQEAEELRIKEINQFFHRLALGPKGGLGSVSPATGETKHGIRRQGHGTSGHNLRTTGKKTGGKRRK